jgi:hypothetical protein
LNEPFQLFTRSGTDKWQVRFSVQGHGQIKKSTGATDQELARKQAWSIWHKAQAQAATGQSIRSRKFTAVLDEFKGVRPRPRAAAHTPKAPPSLARGGAS